MTGAARAARVAVLALVPALAPTLAGLHAQPAPGRAGVVDIGATHQAVTNGYGLWSGVFLRAAAPLGRRDIAYTDALFLRAFRERGGFLSLANRHEWSSRLFTLVGAGGGTGARFLPQARFDATAGVRLGARRTVVASAGASHVRSRDGYRDMAATASLAVYVARAALEAGLRHNTSTPGRVRTVRGYGAATLVPSSRRSFVLRLGAGEEGYQLLGPALVLQRFSSQEASFAWRERMGAGTGAWGVLLQADGYRNPYYTRGGGTLGVTLHF